MSLKTKFNPTMAVFIPIFVALPLLSRASWQINTVAAETDYAYDLTCGAGRNDGNNRIYAGNRNTCLYEYTYNSGSWERLEFGQSGYELSYHGVALGVVTDLPYGNTSALSLVTGNQDDNMYAFYYNGLGFQESQCSPSNPVWKTAIGRGRNTAISYAYIVCTTFSSVNVYECRYNGSAWNSPVTVGSVGSGTAAYAIDVGPGRNGDANNYVYAGGSSSGLYEFCYTGASPWPSTLIANTGAQINDILTAQGRNGSANYYIYSGNENGQVWESFYNGAAWQSTSITASSIGAINALAVGDGRNDGAVRLYAATDNNRIYEFTWSGTCWGTPVDCGSPSASDLKSLCLGPGRNTGANYLYAGSTNFTVYEYEWVPPTTTVTATVTATLTPSPVFTATPTVTPTPTATFTPTGSATQTISATATRTPTIADSPTCSATSTATRTGSATLTPSNTATIFPTGTPTPTHTCTPTLISSAVVSVTNTASPTRTTTGTNTPVPSSPAANIVIFPNPGENIVHFVFDLAATAKIKVVVYNINIERVAVMQDTLPEGKGQMISWNCRFQAPGIYLACIYQDGREIKKCKVVVRH